MGDPYRDPDLVELYDLDNAGGEDHTYYRALAEEIAARLVIDLGCGTGLLTRSLAKPGRTVIGVDPSRTMLDYARRQPGAESVRWIRGDASAIAPTGAADLAICTGNAIMHVAPAELPSTLMSLARALRPGGVLSFDTLPACRRAGTPAGPAPRALLPCAVVGSRPRGLPIPQEAHLTSRPTRFGLGHGR